MPSFLRLSIAAPRTPPIPLGVACWIGAVLACLPSGASAEEPPRFHLQQAFYGDNAEFSNPFRTGETTLGSYTRLFVSLPLGDEATVRFGIFASQRFGSESAFDLVRPIVSLTIGRPASRWIFGTLEPNARARGIGPDRDTLHALVPPLQVETLAFTRPHESGLQWLLTTARVTQDVWLNWQRLNTPEHRETFSAGAVSRVTIRGPFALGGQFHLVHHGGQLFRSGPVSDNVAYGPGIIIGTDPSPMGHATVEAYGLLSHDRPDRATPERTTTGAALFVRSALEVHSWRGHLIVWRGCDFMTPEGDPNYQARKKDGRLARSTRDYSELGLTRAFRPARAVGVEASIRLHRIERHYEYSYRILATVDFALTLGD